jgi:tRNA(Ile)-lysidine synthase
MDRVKELFPQKLLLFELLRPFAFTEDVVSEILQSLDKQSGTFFVSKTHQIAIDRNQLVLSPRRNKTTKELAIYDEGSYRLEDNQILSFCFSDDLRFLKDRDKVYIDASLLVFPLIIRHKVDGDKFVPLGMRGYKKLSNFFVDEKVPLALKTKVPILCNGNGDIIWVLGMRQDERYKLTDKSKKVAIFEILNQ